MGPQLFFAAVMQIGASFSVSTVVSMLCGSPTTDEKQQNQQHHNVACPGTGYSFHKLFSPSLFMYRYTTVRTCGASASGRSKFSQQTADNLIGADHQDKQHHRHGRRVSHFKTGGAVVDDMGDDGIGGVIRCGEPQRMLTTVLTEKEAPICITADENSWGPMWGQGEINQLLQPALMPSMAPAS